MLIKVFDAYIGEPGGLTWDGLASLGELELFDQVTREELLAHAADADIAVSNKQRWDAEALAAAPNLKMIALTATGFNLVDLAEATRRGIVVANVPAYSTPDVAQMAMALLLELCNRVGDNSRDVMAGRWTESPMFVTWEHPLIALEGKTLGIVGMGDIGRRVSRMARAFGMQVVFANRTPRPEFEGEGCRQVSLDELFACSDAISLHCAAAPETVGMIDGPAIERMKDGVLIVNTARGTLIDERALRAALDSGKVGGAGLDVVAVEPMRPDCPLLGAPNTVITPHIGWASVEARTRLIAEVVANVRAFIDGSPRNVVNPQVLRQTAVNSN